MKTVDIIIRGEHNTGRTTLASLIREFLAENGYKHVTFKDAAPLPQEQKPEFHERFAKNRENPVRISVETVGG